MAPKKDKGKKDKDDGGAFTEVEKTFLELQLADCNRKLVRLRSVVDELELRNEELQKEYDKLDEDRADIIAFLKKSLSVKSEENNELKEKVKGLEEIREIETSNFKETVAELEKNFTFMKDQLSSENKLLAGKLNTLEEFRAIRDDLMRKFEKQEQDFKDQEMKYKRIIYEAEKKFVIGKDKLKKEMEARLLQLAQDFQDATELRIAASTHRVIRENIAINNELDSVLNVQKKLSDQNETFKAHAKSASVAKELAEEERDKAINKNVVQLKVIEQLTAAFQEIKKEKGLYEKRYFDFEALQAKIQKLTKENDNLSLQVRILEQNLHTKMAEQNKSIIESSKLTKERNRLKSILKDAAFSIQAALKLDQWAETDETREKMDRKLLLASLLDIVSQHREIERAESINTIASISKVYQEGDLGFVPKPVVKRPPTRSQSRIQSRESIKTEKEKRSIKSISLSSSSLGSIKTLPSIQILPENSESKVEVKEKDSVESFVTSAKSTETTSSSESQRLDAGMTEIEKKLAQSKLEIQKSIMKDLAFSQISLHNLKPIDNTDTDKPVATMTTIVDEEVVSNIMESEEQLEKAKDTEPTEDNDREEKEQAEDDKPQDTD